MRKNYTLVFRNIVGQWWEHSPPTNVRPIYHLTKISDWKFKRTFFVKWKCFILFRPNLAISLVTQNTYVMAKVLPEVVCLLRKISVCSARTIYISTWLNRRFWLNENSSRFRPQGSWHHKWIDFVVGSDLIPTPRVFSGFFCFPPSTETNTFKFEFDLERTDTCERAPRAHWCPVGRLNILHTYTHVTHAWPPIHLPFIHHGGQNKNFANRFKNAI